MVELSTGTAITAAAGGGALVVLLAALVVHSGRRWRAASRRLTAVASRPAAPGAPQSEDRDVVGRVERLAHGAVLRLSPAGALGAVGVGVVVCDEAGGVVHDGGGEVAAGGAVADAVRAVWSRPSGDRRQLVSPLGHLVENAVAAGDGGPSG